MDVCKICSKPIENGKYCKRCKLQKQAKYVEPIEKTGQFIKDKVASAGIAIIGSAIAGLILGKLNDSSSDDTA